MIGYLTMRTPEGDAPLHAAFLSGLGDAGLQENRDFIIAFAPARGRVAELKPLLADLLARPAAVIFAASSSAAVAAKAATATVPIVYTGSSDPVKLGLAASLGRPGGNLTGITRFSHTFSAKRLEMLHDLVPQARTTVGVLVNPANPSAAEEAGDIRAAAATLGLQAIFVEAPAEAALDTAFARLAESHVRLLYLVDDPMFSSLSREIAARALKQSIALISSVRAISEAGALASYGADMPQSYRDAGVYVGRILKGAKPADLPIMLPTHFIFTINLKTARALGLTVPPSVLARADEVLE